MIEKAAGEAEIPPELLILSSLPDNKHCVDCGAPSAEWTSLGFGVFICMTCAGFHRSLGTHLTLVRSCKLDTWDNKHILKYLSLGGNEAFTDYLRTVNESYSDTELHHKYSVPEVLYYRQDQHIV
jgi:hypothetical protein